MNTAIVVFTAKSVESMLRVGGSAAWKLDRRRARQAKYLVCTRNAHAPDSEGTEPHASGFLVGSISDVLPAPGEPDRWLIKISEYVVVDVPNVWGGYRNPIKYKSLEDVGIDPDGLRFMPVPENPDRPRDEAGGTQARTIGRLTIAEAKQGLAAAFGVPVDKVEITIRG